MPSWTFTTSTPVAGQLVLSGNGAGTSLADGSFLCRLTFHFQGATSNLNWYDADIISCAFTDASTGLPLYDQPQAFHYIDGSIVSCICP